MGDDRITDGRGPGAPPGELLHLDLLRFVASVGIMLAHSLEFLAPPPLRPAWRLRLGGLPLFVDSFFVISGFVIARLYAGRIGTWRDYGAFLQRRVARLVPLHLATLLAWLVLYAAMAAARVPVHHDVSLTPRCIATAALLLTSFVDCGGLAPAGVSWSISAEMAMYVLFPALLWATRGRAGPSAALAAAFFAAVLLLQRGDPDLWQAHLSVGRAFPAFTVGVALWAAGPLIGRLPSPRVAMAIAAGLLFGSMLVLVPEAVLIAAAYLLPAFAIAADRRGAGPLVRRLAPLGELTYSIYLLHGLVIAVALNAIADKLLHLRGLAMAGVTVAAWGATLVLARWSYRHLETPARAAINGWRLLPSPARARTPVAG